jgi:hypothetical protein
MEPFYTQAGPARGPVLHDDIGEPVPVFAVRNDPIPIGTAELAGCTLGGIALWRLTIHGAAQAGLWLILGRQFLPAPQQSWRETLRERRARE